MGVLLSPTKVRLGWKFILIVKVFTYLDRRRGVDSIYGGAVSPNQILSILSVKKHGVGLTYRKTGLWNFFSQLYFF